MTIVYKYGIIKKQTSTNSINGDRSDLMSQIINYDICAVIIYLVLIGTMILKKMTRGTDNKVFLLFLFVGATDSILSLSVSLWNENINSGNVGIITTLQGFYLVFRNLHGLMYALYVVAITDTWHKLKYHKIFSALLFIPYIISLALLCINVFTHNVFYYDSNLTYVRGDFFLILYISGVIYVTFGVLYLIKYRKLVRKDKIIAIMLMVPFEAGSMLIQYLNPTLVVEMLTNVIAMLIVFIMVQRPEDYIEPYTGFKNDSTYKEDMKRCYGSGKNVDIIIFNIKNYEAIISMIGYEKESVWLKNISARIISCLEKRIGLSNIYYLGRGRFRLVISHEKRMHTEQIAKSIKSAFKENVEFYQSNINILSTVCIVQSFVDFSNYSKFSWFDNEIEKVVQYSGDVIWAKDVLSKNKLFLSERIDSIIERALANHYLEVYYQPIYSIVNDDFHSAEALLRLKDPEYGFVPPDVFIPAAEKSGAIYRIGDFVFEEVCKFIASEQFKNSGLKYIEVNLSTAQCMQKEMSDNLINIMRKYNVRAEQINLEITETVASYDQNVMMDNIEKLIQNGFSFSLDDYGTGYSNIKRVASLPLNIVKLDKTFVNMEENPKMWIILKNTIQMIKEMNLKTVIEGVETKQMAEKFRELECEYIQGYYFSKPIPQKELLDFLAKQKNHGKTLV